jgi:putative hydrolase of HD superfamily
LVDDVSAIAAFSYEMGVLKRVRRSGWWHAGVANPESVAEHSLRVAQLAALIAAEEGADPGRAAMLGIWHDSQETRTGDLPHSAKRYLAKPDARAITADQTADLPESAGDLVRSAVDEYEAGQTAEAHCAKDADRVEMLLQAIEYRDIGVSRVDGWIESARNGLHTDTAKRLAEAALRTSPLSWRGR